MYSFLRSLSILIFIVIFISINKHRLNLQMGLGKTLTAISVLWSFVRRGGCKGVIVCPSSLVDNWEKEIKKWMGVKLKALCVRSTAGTGECGVMHVMMCSLLLKSTSASF